MSSFDDLVAAIPRIGLDWHADTLIDNTRTNHRHILLSTRPLQDRRTDCALVVSAGPSLYQRGILARVAALRAGCTVIAVDAALVQCLRAGITPDYVISIDPHPTRIVRWFGDPDLAEHTADDDYFARQDLDEAFRANARAENELNIELVNECSRDHSVRLILACCVSESVVRRTYNFRRRHWFAPLVDSPSAPNSLTRRMADLTGLPALNTGGTVGTAAIMFAHAVLGTKRVGVVGMDLGYAADTPLERTQSWNMLKDRQNPGQYYREIDHPVYGKCYTDPTYWWYRQNLLELVKVAGMTLYNCSESGALYGDGIEYCSVEAFVNG